MTTMMMMTAAASNQDHNNDEDDEGDNDAGVEVTAGMTELWQWSRRGEEENATGSSSHVKLYG